ncbi:hypothetical protein BJY00DRAFT_271019 [Aspergillus carlsbadensis]|nr:hypothetical protein BJY00DRAFT_271019 [Aspergillus carlsbadensis]
MVRYLNPPPLALVATIARLFIWLSNNVMGVGLLSACKQSNSKGEGYWQETETRRA